MSETEEKAPQADKGPEKNCANCGHLLSAEAKYCIRCGQKDHDLHVPLKHLLEEALEGFLHFDHASLTTLKALAFKPGFLTAEFLRGRRVRYVAPVRLYIFISFFFFLLQALPSGEVKTESKGQRKGLAITYHGFRSDSLRGVSEQRLDSLLQERGTEVTPFSRYILKQMIRLGNEGTREFSHVLVKAVSYMMFLLMPVFALAVYGFYRKKAVYYIGALIFSVHQHAFAFLLLIVISLVNRMFDLSFLWLLPLILLPFYLFLALRCVYAEGRSMTLLKTLALSATELLCLAGLFLTTVLFSLLLF